VLSAVSFADGCLGRKEALRAPQKDAAPITNAAQINQKLPANHGAVLPAPQKLKKSLSMDREGFLKERRQP